MNFTRDQQRIIDSRGKNLLVSAAAGSGKTTVLVERVMSLIAEGANVDDFLIVTFTRAASADMRRKLYEKLLKRAEQNDRHFAEQLERLDFASISTIHSFCMDVLRDNYEKADIDPAFRVMDEAEQAMLLNETLDEVLEKAYSDRDSAMEQLIAHRAPNTVKDLVTDLYGYLCTRPDSRQWFENAVSLMEEGAGSYEAALTDEISSVISDMLPVLKRVTDICNSAGGPYTYAPVMEKTYDSLSFITGRDYGFYHDLYASGFGFDALSRKRMECDADKKEQVQYAWKTIKDKVKQALALASLLPELARADLKEDVPVFTKLYTMAEEVRSILREKKKERGVVTFDDMEHYTLEILSDPEAAAAVRRRYKYIFVDEYQDTSDTQNALISAVAGENNLFMVGDVKQSIYRFRNAVPELFSEKYERYRAGTEPMSECIVLKENFRSRRSVLNFVNRVFERVMVGGKSDILYDEDARLNPGGSFEGPDAPVELLIVDLNGKNAEAGEGEEEEDAENKEKEELENDCKEALAVARRIHELMAEDESISFKDICVLSRAKTHMNAMAEIFAAESIPCYAEGTEEYYETAEVTVLKAALKLLVSRKNDVELLTVLHSPMFSVSEPELAQMKVGAPKDTPLWEAAELESENNPKIARFLELYSVWRECLHGFGLCELIRKILSDTGFYAFAGAMPGGEQRQGNLDLFCQNALAYERSHGCSLTGFLDFVEEKEQSSDAGGASILTESDDVVRLMTDHKSKGLEFKVVFAVNLERGFSGGNRSVMLYKDKELGIAMQHHDRELVSRRDTIALKAIDWKNKRKDLAEELRILYVTMTRAIDRLILVGSVKNLESRLTRWKLQAQCPGLYDSCLDIVAAAAIGCPGSELLFGRTGEALPGVKTAVIQGGDMEAGQDAGTADGMEILRGMLASDKLDKELYETILWKYPEKEKPYTPVKLAVTGLNREFTGGDRLPEVMTEPDFISGRDKGESTNRGTAIHMALRKLDYAPFAEKRDYAFVRGEVARQLDELAARDILTAEERAYVNPALIADFVLSGIGVRFMNAETKRREMSFSLRMPIRRVIPDYPEDEGDIFVQGCIDMCFIENGSWVLVDYKTNRTSDIDELISQYKYQLDVYAEALETLTGIPVSEAYLCLLTLHKQIRVETGRWEKQ